MLTGNLVKASIELFTSQYPSAENTKSIGKDFPHKKEEMTKVIITMKLKAIRSKFRTAVDSGRTWQGSSPLLWILWGYMGRISNYIHHRCWNWVYRHYSRCRIKKLESNSKSCIQYKLWKWIINASQETLTESQRSTVNDEICWMQSWQATNKKNWKENF